MDTSLMHERQQMGLKVQLQRKEVDSKMMQERADMDRYVQQERKLMDVKLKHERAEIDRKVQQELKVMDGKLVQARAEMDLKVQQDREEMDRELLRQRVQMDCKQMELRAELYEMLEAEREKIEHRVHLEHLQKDCRLMQECETLGPQDVTHHRQEDLPLPRSDGAIVMEFRIHIRVKLSWSTNQFRSGSVGSITFREPNGVDWGTMMEILPEFGYNRNSSLYYLVPGSEPPDGLVLLPEDNWIDTLMEAHEGKNICDLYIVRKPKSKLQYHTDEENYDFGFSSDSDDGVELQDSEFDSEPKSQQMYPSGKTKTIETNAKHKKEPESECARSEEVCQGGKSVPIYEEDVTRRWNSVIVESDDA